VGGGCVERVHHSHSGANREHRQEPRCISYNRRCHGHSCLSVRQGRRSHRRSL